MVAPTSDVGTSDDDAVEDVIVTGTDDDQHLVSYILLQHNNTSSQLSVPHSRPYFLPLNPFLYVKEL